MKKKYLALIISGTLFITACSSDQLDGGMAAGMTLLKGVSLSESEVVEASRLSIAKNDKSLKTASASSKYTKRLNNLTKNLKTYEGLSLNYKVYISDQVNAFATPDGSVRVYSGLMDKMNDDELLAVIGHEIGHVAEKHSLNQMKKAYATTALRQGIQAQGGNIGGIAASLGDVGEALAGAQFSQSDELSADKYGIKVLKYLGKNPYAVVDAQEELSKLGGGSDSLFSTHPSSAKRIAKAKEEVAKSLAK